MPSVAMDPADGTPGVHWAIAGDLLGAEREALENARRPPGLGGARPARSTVRVAPARPSSPRAALVRAGFRPRLFVGA